jgi:hypothetical protein
MTKNNNIDTLTDGDYKNLVEEPVPTKKPMPLFGTIALVVGMVFLAATITVLDPNQKDD